MSAWFLLSRGFALLLVLGCVAVALADPGARTRARIAERVRRATGQAGATSGMTMFQAGDLRQGLSRRLAQLGERLPEFDPMQRVKLGRQLTRAGLRDRRAVSSMIGIKLSSGLLFAGAALLLSPFIPRFGAYVVIRLLAMTGAFVVGLIVPEYVLAALIARRRRKIAACLPDALDLLVVCTMAGNSLVTSIKRVALELVRICPPLADELSVCADEMTIGEGSAVVLVNFAARVDLPSARSLAATLIQSQQYGTPITQALRTLSRAERAEQLFALEEKAAKLAPKITLPMMVFILPTVALIAGGPAVIRLLTIFK
ncbi:fimbrial protein [Burkholderia sp. MSMB617WGS]|uniref:Fimbrial protein n=1 Tax=Burkholderia savannae TaxID=1637837 RepID=A0ABR5TIU5_9BURK|nr:MULTISPECIES: type II secretion system F family protein [Burkholderia]AOJ70957.1 fimbrial protein [Burkholderia savannae]AOJ82733.1 fimbrial protein [Burkholderia savannae]AOK48887.1 fimbrial protein [Burkholderia sp. MSMB617WGS]KVG42825.1 fimbrial protein [Burkholderia sp. MSMB0265]KVG78476.1 fimbrial protein [Burkholderia sp. MSMB2040]